METFELRYFLGVAATENIREASEVLFVSPGSLSKAISRLEEELQVKLFSRENQRIRLTEEGRLLQIRASEILQLEEATKLELSGVRGTLKVTIAGSELLLGKLATAICKEVKLRHPLAQFEFQTTDDEDALERVRRGEAHLALLTSEIASKTEFRQKILGESTFVTYVGRSHPLAKKRLVSVKELLEHAFVSPNLPLLGKVGMKQSLDGWRDDEFPRRVDFTTSSLKTLEELLVSGEAVAYLPDYLGKDLDVVALKVEGCPYSCSQKIKLVARKSRGLRWIDEIFTRGE